MTFDVQDLRKRKLYLGENDLQAVYKESKFKVNEKGKYKDIYISQNFESLDQLRSFKNLGQLSPLLTRPG